MMKNKSQLEAIPWPDPWWPGVDPRRPRAPPGGYLANRKIGTKLPTLRALKHKKKK